MTMPIAALRLSLDITGDLVAGVQDEQWSQSTPCAAWTVRALIDHLVAGNRLFADILCERTHRAGQQYPEGPLAREPVAAYRAAADDLVGAFDRSGVLEQAFTVPIGLVPGIAALHLRIVEALVHGWDLAQATSQSVAFPDGLVEQEMAFTVAKLADLPAAPAGEGPFGPPQPVPANASPLDRLAALLGRPIPAPPG